MTLASFVRYAIGRDPLGARALLDMLLTWRDRARQRMELARLDDRLLRDIGVPRADAARELGKPFWRD